MTMKIKERKLNRLRDYDCAMQGHYYVTFCIQGRKNWFGEMQEHDMILNQFGIIVKNQWIWLFNQYPYVNLKGLST